MSGVSESIRFCIKKYISKEHIISYRMKRAIVMLPEGVWKVIDREFKGKLGNKKSEIIRNIVIAYLSEKGLLKDME